jgi:hypothetical protein
VVGARPALGNPPPPADPLAPGPFAFADEQRLHGLLAEAGFGDVQLQRFDAPNALGASAHEAALNCLQIGPVSRLLREVGAAHQATIVDAIETALKPHAGADGSVSLGGSIWVVTATRG